MRNTYEIVAKQKEKIVSNVLRRQIIKLFFLYFFSVGISRQLPMSLQQELLKPLNFLLLMIKENDTILTLGMRFSQG